MTTLQPQSPTSPVAGAYAQPAPGLAIAGVMSYGDSQVTAQVATSTAAPGAGATVATVTPGAAGLWKVSGTVSISGTTVAANETNNARLIAGSTTILSAIPIAVNGTTGAPGAVPFGPVILSLTAADAVKVVAIAASTGSSIYGAQICCQLVG
ncbi:MAG TPA: hypothetical protein VHA75_00825 [Rugosimonospora sp.]|nr:hypothetical protein [Rugosimonospora sp.]